MRSWLFAAALFCGACAGGETFAARASGAYYPPVGELQRQLDLYPGAPLPKLIAYGGRLFHPRYVSARAVGGGEYAVVIRLEQER